MKKTAIPRPNAPLEMQGFCDATKETLDKLTGQNRAKENLTELPSTATLPDVINTLNIIIRRLGSD